MHHRSTPIEFASTRDDRVISVGLDRVDEIGLYEVTGAVAVLLTIVDTASVDHAGDDRVLETALSATDARFLMAALGVEVDRFEQLMAAAR